MIYSLYNIFGKWCVTSRLVPIIKPKQMPKLVSLDGRLEVWEAAQIFGGGN